MFTEGRSNPAAVIVLVSSQNAQLAHRYAGELRADLGVASVRPQQKY